MSKWPNMAFTPQDWVDNNINKFGNPIEVILEMIESMRGSMVPDDWITEAITYAKRKAN